MTILRLRLIFCGPALVLAILIQPAQAEEPVTLRVLCYNIHYGQGNDGEYNTKRLAEVINSTKPDLVALQEVDVGVQRSGRIHEASQLSALTGMAVRFGPTQHYEGGLFGNAVMTRLPVLDVVIHPLPYTESTPELITYPRGAIAVTVQLQDGRPLRFISTHFQHNVPEDRVQEAKAINQLFASGGQTPSDGTTPAAPSGTQEKDLNADNHDDGMLSILAGDINATPDAEPVRILQEHWTNAIDAQASPTVPSHKPTSRIDYIFFRGNSLRMRESQVIGESMASDHRPVFAILEVSKD